MSMFYATCAWLWIISLHFAACRDGIKITCLQENPQEYRRQSEDYFNKPLLKKLTCASKMKGKHIDKISKCFATENFLNTMKESARDFLQNPLGDRALLPLGRCLGRVKIKSGDDAANKKAFHKCLADNDFENTLTDIMNKELSENERSDYEELMTCLSKSENDDDIQTQMDCIHTNPILEVLIDLMQRKAPIPYIIND